jgi:hypothetical protein
MFYFDLAVKSSRLLAATNPPLIILKWGTDKPLYRTLHLTELMFLSVPRLSVRLPGVHLGCSIQIMPIKKG